MTTFTGTSGNDILPPAGADNSGNDVLYQPDQPGRLAEFKADEKRGTFPLGGRRCDHQCGRHSWSP